MRMIFKMRVNMVAKDVAAFQVGFIDNQFNLMSLLGAGKTFSRCLLPGSDVDHDLAVSVDSELLS